MTPQVKQRIEQIRRGEVPEGYKKAKVGIVPMEWVYEKLDQYLISHREVSEYSNQYPVLTSSRKGIFLQSEYYTREVASEDNTGYNVVPRGYFTYRHMSDDEIFKFNINNIVDRGIVSTLYPVFKTHNINDYFLQTILNEGREFRRFAILQKQGGSRTYMYFEKLKNLKVCLPSIAEQEKIAEILSVQDKVIALKEKLIKEKKQQKKALMQKLLSCQERLPSFSDKWKNVLFKDIYQYAKEGGTPSTGNDLYYQNGEIPFIKIENLSNKYIDSCEEFITEEGLKNSSAWIIPENNIIFSNGATIGRISINKIPVCTKQGILGIIPKSIFSTEFLYYYFSSRLFMDNVKRITTHGTMDVAYLKDINSIRLYIPKSKEEQNAIADILINADREIELLEKELDQEKQKKKALMQLLLTGIVRV